MMEQQLLAAIYANPRSDEPRRVYADFLQERGDPRGEFIASQLDEAHGSDQRERELLQQHGAKWLEPLNGALVDDSVKWARGFPVAGSLNYDAAFGDRDERLEPLATLEHLDLYGTISHVMISMSDEGAWKFVRNLRHLRTIRGLPLGALVPLAAAEMPYAFETIDCASRNVRPEEAQAMNAALAAAMKRGTGLPALEKLCIDWRSIGEKPEAYAWIAETDAGRRLRSLVVNGGQNLGRPLMAWCIWLATLPRTVRLEELELCFSSVRETYRLRIRRSKGALSLEGKVRGGECERAVRDALEIPGIIFDSVNVEGVDLHSA